jgi:UDP:flavonoid glycosyltransferase YjiC (YdhE family)
MRMLFTTIPSYGHFHALVPLAHAARDGGHEVAVATAAEFRGPVSRADLEHLPAGVSEHAMVQRMDERRQRNGTLADGRSGLEMFARVAAPAMASDLLGLVDAWKPDLIVHEEGEWGGPVAAAVADVPSVAVGWGCPIPDAEDLGFVEELVAPLWHSHHVQPRTPAGLFDHLYLDTCPPSLQTARPADLGPSQQLRFVPFDASAGPEAPLTAGPGGDGPLVYVTLGTVAAFNRGPELLATITEALADEPVRCLVTVGLNNDPAALGPVPSNIRVERYVPQSAVLGTSSLAVTHGGAGSTIAALSFGVPVLVLPRGAPSQRRTADACVRAGVGRVLEAEQISVHAIGINVRALLANQAYGEAAGRLARGIRDVSPPAAILPVLSALAPDGARR